MIIDFSCCRKFKIYVIEQTSLILTGPNDDSCWFVVYGHCPIVGGDRQPAPHLVQAPVHHGAVMVIGINLEDL